jgi:transposase InsO family protein
MQGSEAENQRLRQEIALLQEEARIKDSRMLRIPPPERPHYQPIDRLAILELRAMRGWSLAQTAQRLLLTPATVASWMRRLDDDGPTAIVRTREPVNKYPAFVAYIVRRLKTLAPSLGYAKAAQFLCRAGLHLSATTIRRMQGSSDSKRSNPEPSRADAASRAVKSRGPNHTWLCDLTTVPISLGFWVPWVPRALPQSWPFCWWVAVVIDHYSRRLLGFALYRQQPTSDAVKSLLARIIRRTGCQPKYLVTDQGEQSGLTPSATGRDDAVSSSASVPLDSTVPSRSSSV